MKTLLAAAAFTLAFAAPAFAQTGSVLDFFLKNGTCQFVPLGPGSTQMVLLCGAIVGGNAGDKLTVTGKWETPAGNGQQTITISR